ncbi:hypothetical protein [Actimicrobium antarcticum]|uniref:hypothetical protein n=1 Tax=Actimicrobium antarcticum TaxID=1051899 RepID=UPI0031E0461F
MMAHINVSSLDDVMMVSLIDVTDFALRLAQATSQKDSTSCSKREPSRHRLSRCVHSPMQKIRWY